MDSHLIGNAHSANSQGKSHSLNDHASNVARLAKSFGEHCNLEREAWFAGLWHDIGKMTDAFQHKLEQESRIYAPHKGMGALLAAQNGWFDIPFAIAGHHGGLPCSSEIKSNLRSKMTGSWSSETGWVKIIEELKREKPDWFDIKPPELPQPTSPTAFDLRIRLLYSCLVDADFLDTEAHFDPEKAEQREPFPKLPELGIKFFKNQNELIQKANINFLNDLRNNLYEQTITNASKEPGIFRITIPTGGGKTRAALGFAFKHAEKFGHRRIVIALPYTSIIDQMSDEYRKIFGDIAFLEHHSGQFIAADKEERTPEEVKRMLACENWDANLILTTTVQLFDSLFSNRPSSCRKLHRLARSIIVLDEVQTLPTRLLKPICDILLELVRSYGVTLLLSTATQPALDRVNIDGWDEFDRGEVIDDPGAVYRKMIRVKYELPKDKWNWERVTKEMLSKHQAMVILNTKAQAVELFKEVRDHDENALHLSTFLCGAHRRKVIETVKRRLKYDELCRLVTTQVVEAGVDIDFPLVLRATGPLDRVVQAAGRCNREGKLERGRIIVFKPVEDKKPSGEYRHGADLFEILVIEGKFDPDDPETFDNYFSQLFDGRCLDEEKINEKRNRLDFPAVADKFHLIEKGGLIPVAVGYGSNDNLWDNSQAAKLIEDFRFKPHYSRRELFRRLSPYIVNIFENKINKLCAKGLICLDEGCNIHYWSGEYDHRLGVATEELGINQCVL
ncbi:MAG: CRISPR-associated helicase Cas3' [Candidatus Hatepunaea meridiana]|nr:CRISPR-associated helicase Cas3' [Candidatus Hatepunaea meridiana]